MKRPNALSRGCLFLLCLGLMYLTAGCGILPKEADLPQAPVMKEVEDAEYSMTPVSRGDVVVEQKVRSEYKPARQESLRFLVSGERIAKVYAQAGDTVKEGDLLAELETDALKESRTQEAAKLESMQLDLKQLEEKKDIAVRRAEAVVSLASSYEQRKEAREALDRLTTDYDLKLKRLEAEVGLQQERVEEADEQIRKRQLYAPIDGSVTYARTYGEGATSRDTDTVFTISDISSSVFLVVGEEAALFHVGDEVMVNYEKEDHEGIVVDGKTLGLEAGADDQTYISLVVPDPALEERDKGVITVELESRENVLFVKSSAVHPAGDTYIVYYLDEDGMKSMKEVKPGLDNGEFVEILEGLQEGEEIIDE